MKVSVFGLGYVGCVSTGCLAHSGHKIIGVDISEIKVDLINKGKPTIIEKDIDDLIKAGFENKSIKATKDFRDAVLNSEISLICVGTPSLETGQLNLDYVFNTAKQIGEALSAKTDFHVIVIRSTVFPGTNQKVGEIIENVSGKKRNTDFAVVSNPEFLREGAAVEDYFNPSITVLGTDNKKAVEIMKGMYKNVNGEFVVTDISAAEMIKYVNNTFHALKISFANEIGNICKSLSIDPFKVLELFKMDDRLNISPAYFNPGMAYGGSCLPKDLKGLATISHDNYVKTPVINAISLSNEQQKERTIKIVSKYKKKKIGLLGLAFKKGTDDLRYSPSVELAEGLLGKGYELKIFDSNVHLAKLVGANKSYIEEKLPHLSEILIEHFDSLLETDIIVIAHKPSPEQLDILKKFNGIIVDLIYLPDDFTSDAELEGLSW